MFDEDQAEAMAGETINLLMCSCCGFMASQIVDHDCAAQYCAKGECGRLIDWWVVRAVVLKDEEQGKTGYRKVL